MTPERKLRQIGKRVMRAVFNEQAKDQRAIARQYELVELGKTVIVTEKDGVKHYDFPPTPKPSPEPRIPRLAWLNGKTYKQQGDSRKGRSGHGPENREAFVENASRMFTREVDKVLMPEIYDPKPSQDAPNSLTSSGIDY